MRVTVVTSVELGWDCVVGVYEGNEKRAREQFNIDRDEPFDARIEDEYIFTETNVDLIKE